MSIAHCADTVGRIFGKVEIEYGTMVNTDLADLNIPALNGESNLFTSYDQVFSISGIYTGTENRICGNNFGTSLERDRPLVGAGNDILCGISFKLICIERSGCNIFDRPIDLTTINYNSPRRTTGSGIVISNQPPIIRIGRQICLGIGIAVAVFINSNIIRSVILDNISGAINISR